MLKKNSVSVAIFLTAIFCLTSLSHASPILYKVRVNEDREKVRLVLDLNSDFQFKWARLGKYIQIDIPEGAIKSGTAIPKIKNNKVLEKISTTNEAASSTEASSGKVYIYLKFPSYFNIYPLYYPSRLVLDFRKDLKEFDRRQVLPGLEYIRFAKSNSAGPVAGSLIRVNPKLFDVLPALAGGKRYEPSFWESVMLFFKPIFPWVEERVTHFFKQPTSAIAKRYGAVAAVNGTYFSRSGRPLGILMINGELITSPIYDRTAFLMTASSEPLIDNVLVRTYVSTEAGSRIYITGINEPCNDSDIILYTQRFGSKTDTKGCAEAVVRGREIRELRGENSEIPKDGYVISAGARLQKFLHSNLRSGDRLDINVEIVPYSLTQPMELKQIVGGGPRLVKGGRVYVSKKEEKFKRDIATARTSRTAVGITGAGNILFVAIDKTSRIKSDGLTKSQGMTLEELSELLMILGAVDAMNLDGGGSTTMYLSGEVVNTPANGSEVPVSNAILIRQKI